MLAVARERAASKNLQNIEFREADIETTTIAVWSEPHKVPLLSLAMDTVMHQIQTTSYSLAAGEESSTCSRSGPFSLDRYKYLLSYQ
jgi:hypothetical protein